MNRAWNPEERFFAQSYEDKDIVDSAVLIMPLVFFIPAVRALLALLEPKLTSPPQTEPRFLSTLERILKSPVHGGLTSNVRTMAACANHTSLTVSSQNLVFRYDVTKADDGVGGEEGTFSLCTLWYVSIRIPSCSSPIALTQVRRGTYACGRARYRPASQGCVHVRGERARLSMAYPLTTRRTSCNTSITSVSAPRRYPILAKRAFCLCSVALPELTVERRLGNHVQGFRLAPMRDTLCTAY
jgi:hypothetical protein